jgi:hypothetical protein
VRRHLRARFWVEAFLASVSGVFLILTLLWKDWIEIVFGVDPDHHNGSVEWLIVAVSLATSMAFFVLARLEWRRAPVPQSGHA